MTQFHIGGRLARRHCGDPPVCVGVYSINAQCLRVRCLVTYMCVSSVFIAQRMENPPRLYASARVRERI